MTYYFKQCNLSSNWIQFELDNEMADMKLFNIDESNFKLFCKLISECIADLIEKGIKYIRQMVLLDDYNKFLKSKTTWYVLETYKLDDTILIECKIDEFIKNFEIAHMSS